MAPLTTGRFRRWLEAYGRASQDNDPQASANLFSPQARYYETPFGEPLRGRQAIYDYWAQGARDLVDKESTFEILAVQGMFGLARWQAQFTRRQTGQRLALDCLFLVEFDARGLCCLFREWWHLQEVARPASTLLATEV